MFFVLFFQERQNRSFSEQAGDDKAFNGNSFIVFNMVSEAKDAFEVGKGYKDLFSERKCYSSSQLHVTVHRALLSFIRL